MTLLHVGEHDSECEAPKNGCRYWNIHPSVAEDLVALIRQKILQDTSVQEWTISKQLSEHSLKGITGNLGWDIHLGFPKSYVARKTFLTKYLAWVKTCTPASLGTLYLKGKGNTFNPGALYATALFRRVLCVDVLDLRIRATCTAQGHVQLG